MRARNALLTVVVAGLVLTGQQAAQASDRNAALAGLAVGAVVGGAIVSQSRPVQVYAPPPAYYPPPQVVYYPPPVYYQPRPIYYEPRPVYYRPAPAYSRPYYGPPRHERWRGRDGRR